MAGKRDQPPNGRYVAEEHPTIKGLVCVYWVPQGQHRDPRPLLTLGPGAVPLLAEALADWELAHHAPPPAPQQAPSRRLRAVNDDGVI
jgi:hypothetical protein